ncbi:Na+/H+-dicarboxylate symporter (GltP) (PDB:1XFH) [Commensalibacter communis]|uniref:dicarboxylate/amino acid:cation symporter n=1 Tax=Commensalibacter communis TaxID=2972786 RepID=UPI0022FFA775|nr:dicarboxylate/amino acid:cation symporter [Commensalibacter communis]CAI3943420.1 Na+/H+-dicarboxylate symporter (GltP) (PDB:1XFH) [Commensalibacter communis]CAI3944729.1 Na+/H+-dicarboxylate symporter (GltP) (PDB:1XFH) [Commensalibacter communis]
MASEQIGHTPSTSSNSLLRQVTIIGIAMISGLILGLICHAYGQNIHITKTTDLVSFIMGASDLIVHLFLRLIKMIVAPLVLTTLIAGISNVQDTSTIKTIGIKVILWFIVASFVSLAVGMVYANIVQPGVGFTDNPPPIAADHSSYHFDIVKFILHIVPDSIVDAMAKNDMIQLVVFAVFFGLGLAKIPGKSAQILRDGIDAMGHVMLKVTDMVMKIVPLVVFASLLSIATQNGIQIIGNYGIYLVEFYILVLIMWGILIGAGYCMMGKKIFKLLPFISEPVLVGFSTASSESAFPRLLEKLTEFGVSPKISAFVLPLGYSFNLCGTMVFLSFAAIFIAQVYNVNMPWDKQMMMLLVMMISSKGIAGVPRASTVMLAAVMPGFDIPAAGLALIVGIDQFLDMARTATSVLGNGIVAAIADEWDQKEQLKKSKTTTI